jgi:hypothetical protein
MDMKVMDEHVFAMDLKAMEFAEMNLWHGLTIKILGSEWVGDILYYCVYTESERGESTVLRSYEDFVEFDHALDARSGPPARGVLPRAEFFGFRRMLNVSKFLVHRQTSLQQYLDVLSMHELSPNDKDVQEFLFFDVSRLYGDIMLR